jgi:hypothetical protein
VRRSLGARTANDEPETTPQAECLTFILITHRPGAVCVDRPSQHVVVFGTQAVSCKRVPITARHTYQAPLTLNPTQLRFISGHGQEAIRRDGQWLADSPLVSRHVSNHCSAPSKRHQWLQPYEKPPHTSSLRHYQKKGAGRQRRPRSRL